jgi:hypothetical protein
MAVTVKKVTLWRSDVKNKPGVLGKSLHPLALAGANLQVVMGYRYGDKDGAVIEVCPVSGKKAIAAAKEAGFKATAIPTVLVTGDDRPGLGHSIGTAIADAGINMVFLVAQVIAKKFSAVVGFENEAAAGRATTLIKKAARKRAKK